VDSFGSSGRTRTAGSVSPYRGEAALRLPAAARTPKVIPKVIPSSKDQFLATIPAQLSTQRLMHKKSTQQTIQLSAIVSGHLIDGTVTSSPAPPAGILSEFAKFLAAVVWGEIEFAHLGGECLRGNG
jgi:hypothetical protein